MNKALVLICISLFAATEARFTKLNVNLALTVAEDSHQLTEDMVRICQQDTDISMDELHKFRNHDFSNASEASQCFTHCLYEQMGLMRDGVFVERDFIRKLADITDPNTYAERDCHGLLGTNKCETAYKIHQCKQQLRSSELARKEQKEQQRAKSAETAVPAPPPVAELVE
ncbi:general odorant-binding protein 56a [Scaptodrosophila lebanonensis]|uniref:General odorant-binding protein 56a n=1 Tax=Drosophila lebanonensis TaxID=7225 RepID=A0A6J2UMV1_DROLE|nr:general odorant-binding protein 56a [Scaptodrosophila lebanonensis]